MRNLKVTRRLRGQTVSGLRKKLRVKSEELSEISAERGTLAIENARLRSRPRPPQNLPIPETFSDMLIDRFCDYLAEGMARKVAEEVPELERAAHVCARYMHGFLQGKLTTGIRFLEDAQYMVEEVFMDNDLEFSLYLHAVDVHYREDLNNIRAMVPWTPIDTVKEPKRIVITNHDFTA